MADLGMHHAQASRTVEMTKAAAATLFAAFLFIATLGATATSDGAEPRGGSAVNGSRRLDPARGSRGGGTNG